MARPKKGPPPAAAPAFAPEAPDALIGERQRVEDIGEDEIVLRNVRGDRFVYMQRHREAAPA